MTKNITYPHTRVVIETITSNVKRRQWRIQDFPRGGANSQNCYYFSHFCRKLHENERIWTPRGDARPWRPPPLDPPMEDHEDNSYFRKSSTRILNVIYIEPREIRFRLNP